MIRVAAAPKSKQQSRLEQLKASAVRWRGGEDARARPPQPLRDEAVAAVRAGVPATDVAAAIGMAAWTVSRWVKAAKPEAAVRELRLVAAPPPRPSPRAAGDPTASVRLPNGICLDVPVSALTADLVGELLAAGGVR